MIKTTVGEFRDFLAADYGAADDGWFEEICFYVDGSDEPLESDECIFCHDQENSLPAATAIKFDGGVIVFPLKKRRDPVAIEPLFRKWAKAKTHNTVLVRVPKTRMSEFDEAIGKCGAVIVK